MLVAGAVQSQTIGGAVFGGGRMADVNGSTLVTVLKCNDIPAVYGGNDIAGKVCGATTPVANDSSFTGSQVVIGTEDGTDIIHIGSVYGGGNGYYYYPAKSGESTDMGTSVTSDALAAGTIHNYTYDATNPDAESNVDVVEVAVGLYVPQVTKTSVSLHSNNVYVDSVFGGAKNAFITATVAEGSEATVNSTEVKIYGGTVYALFGGNNFGGSLGSGSAQLVNVYITSIDNTTSANLGGSSATGLAQTTDLTPQAHGIRYLFGGGNRAAGQNAEINIYGGQIDTLFGGGNSADVVSTTVTVNVTSPLYTVAQSPYVDATTTSVYDPVTSVYDIRCLFGGNNAASMSGVPTLTLTKGGIHNLYGGGNKGDMNGSQTYTDNDGNTSATRSTNVVVNSTNIIIDTIYGGGQSAGTSYDTYVKLTDGKVGTIFGGTNISGTIPPTAKSNVCINGVSAIVYNSVFGGSNGYYRCMSDDTYDPADAAFSIAPNNPYQNLAGKSVPAIYHTNVLISNGLVREHVYAGGNLAMVSKPNTNGSTKVTISGGNIGDIRTGKESTATVFGGGNFANVYGTADVHITGSPIITGDVYGGNDKTGTVTGAGRSGYSSSTESGVTVDNMSGYIYSLNEGGNIALTQQNAATYVLIEGTPTITGSVYGGGNGAYNYQYYDNTEGVVTVDNGFSETVFRCSRPTSIPTQFSGFVDIKMTNKDSSAGTIGSVFAGGNSATVGVNSVTSGDGTTLVSGSGQAFVYVNCQADVPTSSSTTNVGSLFGGNNRVDMDKVPHLWLIKGKLGSIYGGGNLGGMNGAENIEGKDVSTYIAMGSDKVLVKNIFGGCNAADVFKGTYLHLRKGTVSELVFGGNDLSGEVPVARVFIDGQGLSVDTIYGGGNGNYAMYKQERDENGAYYTKSNGEKVYARTDQKAAAGAENGVADKYCTSHFTVYDLKGRPYVDSAAVVINGDVTVYGNIYGGGVSGDCRKTDVLIDAADGKLHGMVFGAGQGRVDNRGLRIDGTCKALYIGVAQDANHDGVTDRNNDGNIIYGEDNAMGNVLDKAVLTVRQFHSMEGSRSAMFGGGENGNVGTSEVHYENTATAPLKALYLGCLASDVNHAIGIINASESPTVSYVIDTIYGGNDFSGKVGETDLTVNTGIFNYLFGAGNGDYDYRQWLRDRIGSYTNQGLLYDDRSSFWKNPTTACSAADSLKDDEDLTCADIIPYSMKVNVTINGGTFLNTVYGGGNMGLVGNRDLNPAAVAADDYGLITVNVHGGDFRRHIFAGARGKTDMGTRRYFGARTWTNTAFTDGTYKGVNVDEDSIGKQLVYGLKVLNMDGGTVEMSVYGGSESVDDGYPYECMGRTFDHTAWYNNRSSFNTNTTLRPSSVLNFVGGTVEKSVYGGGYQGNIYGSVYVNIGSHAVYDSPVWTATSDYDMSDYKPNITGLTRPSEVKPANEYLTADISNPLYFRTSIYNGSDWGEALDNPYFNTRGVYGGKTNILIDGKGYNTSQTNTDLNSLPVLNIRYSVIGSGTSTEGGDVNRLITIRHYGDWDDCRTSRTLSSIQRADRLVLDSVFINLEGEQDAYSAYASSNYSLCRLDTVAYVVDNIIMLNAPAIYIGSSFSLKENVPVSEYSNHLYTNTGSGNDGAAYEFADNRKASNLLDNLDDGEECSYPASTSHCEGVDFCNKKVPSNRGTGGKTGAFNTLLLENGSYMRITRFVDTDNVGVLDANADYGSVNGWMFLANKDKTRSYVYARNKDENTNPDDGGFVAPCKCDNYITFTGEMDYVNANNTYRTWTVGSTQGSRKRHITLIANADPDRHTPLNGTFHVYQTPNTILDASTRTFSSTDKLAYYTATLELPPSNGGNFYVINEVTVDQENGGDMKLVQEGYCHGNTTETSYIVQPDVSHQTTGSNIDAIKSDTNGLTFGLTFTTDNSGSNFTSSNTSCWTNGLSNPLTLSGAREVNSYSDCWPYSLVMANRWFSQTDGYISPAIIDGTGIIPTMQFTLTFNTDFHNTITRDILFRMDEYDASGNYVGPVEVTITISSVIKDFGNLEVPLLAMYNEGITNEYVRKVTIPAGFLQRDVYIDGIEWSLNDLSGTEDDDYFHMQGSETAINNNNHFSIIVTPTENANDNITNHIGWYHIQNNDIDVYNTALADFCATRYNEDPSVEATTFLTSPDQSINYSTSNYLSDADEENYKKSIISTGNGMLVGTLDGRAPAAMEVKLLFNGDYVYHDRFNPNYLADIKLSMHWVNTKTEGDGHFDIYIKLRTREHGDTIYWAPEESLERNGITLNSFRSQSSGGTSYSDVTISPSTEYAGLIYGDPRYYLQSLQDVTDMYEEGDVIDILNTVNINGTDGYVNISGDDYSTIQIIRYSGSHFSFPGLECANTNALFDVTGGISMRNVMINGSYCTRVKESTTTQPSGTVDVDYTHVGNLYYDKSAQRVKATLESEAPIFYCHGDGSINLSYNVRLLNNLNKSKNNDGTPILGGAIAIVQDNPTLQPEVIVGNNVIIADNLVVDWNAVNTPSVDAGQPLNYGAGVYIDGGKMTLGSSATNSSVATKININRNFYMKNESTGVKARTKHELGGGTTNFEVYILDTVNHADAFSLSNVYLTRTTSSSSCPNAVRSDTKSDVLYLASTLDAESRIGISKWFPGYKYDGTVTTLHNEIPRDTIGIVFQSYGTTDLIKEATSNGVFFNDSAYFSISARSPEINIESSAYTTAGSSFNKDANDRVTYSGISGSNYGDRVFVFFHEYVNSNRAYLQRCATFGKGVVTNVPTYCDGTVFSNFATTNNTLAYHWNKDATCIASTDSIMFHVGGGFFPYTYTWYKDEVSDWTTPTTSYNADTYHPATLTVSQMRQRQTFGGNNITSASEYNALLRKQAMVDTLIFTSLHQPQSQMKSTYLFRVQANDITGNCMIEQPFMLRVSKNSNSNYTDDDSNFLCHRDPQYAYNTHIDGSTNASYNANYKYYRVYSPGVDSSNFHDNEGHTGVTWNDTAADNTITEVGLQRAESPYFDSVAAYYSGLLGTVYEGADVPRYMRTYRSYKITADMLPEAAKYAADDYMEVLADDNTTVLDIDNVDFCPGDIVNLHPKANTNYEYMAWSFDPSSAADATYVVANGDNDLEVYYSPNDYWYNIVTSRPAGYTPEYNGDVTITSHEGLAWLISTVNGYNGQNAHSFQNNTITINISGEADMGAHKWTPLGNLNNPFRGTIKVADNTSPNIKNIIVNEPILPRVGMFGYTDGAGISGFQLTNVAIKGNSYVGGLVAEAHGTKIKDIKFDGGHLFSEYVVGGVVAKGEYDRIERISWGTSALNFAGNAINAGTFIATGSTDTIVNDNLTVNAENLSAVNFGGLAGEINNPGKKSTARSLFNNNYVRIITGNKSQHVGGLVGRANNVDMNNNYVHGSVQSSGYAGALVGYLGQNVSVSNCYYSTSIKKGTVGYTLSGSAVQNTSSFSGSGNQVQLTNRVNGYTNLTRALNGWVKTHPDEGYRTWRSDLDHSNFGYPLFGTPDMITINDSVNVTSCDSVEWDGIIYYEPGRYIFHVVDSADYLDSTFTLLISIGYGDSTQVSDSIALGDGYEGYGFSLSADDISAAIHGTEVRQSDVMVLRFVDSLYNATGCDSIVTLTLYVTTNGVATPEVIQQLNDVKVYPNPTRGLVNVEGSDLQSIEVYDNVSRRVINRKVDGDKATFDLGGQPSGSYYIRIRTAHGTVVKKLIKK